LSSPTNLSASPGLPKNLTNFDGKKEGKREVKKGKMQHKKRKALDYQGL
jgi:hypothetical protein